MDVRLSKRTEELTSTGAEPLLPEEIAPEFRAAPKSYARPMAIEGVRTMRLPRFTDERGFLLELYRSRGNGSTGEELSDFFAGVSLAQVNFSTVDVPAHIKGLHYHLKQDDIWFFPPPSKAKVVLYDVRKDSPSFGQTQTVVAGGGQDVLVRIPVGVAHGYRPLTVPCALLYFVTETFDPASPDEFRIPWDHPAVKDLWDVPHG